MKTMIAAILSLFWVAIGYLGLREAGRRFFTGRYRAEAAAAAIVIAFALGMTWPRGDAAGIVAAPPPPVAAAAPAAAPPAAAAPVTDVGKACAAARLAGVAGKGNVDAAAIVTGGIETPAGPLPELHGGNTLVVRGWAANPELGAPAAAACVVVDGKILAATKGVYGGSRPDVAAAFNAPALVPTAFQLFVAASAMPTGRHRMQVAAVAADGTAGVIAGGLSLIVAH